MIKNILSALLKILYIFLFIFIVNCRFVVLKLTCIVILSFLCFHLFFKLKCCGYNYGNASDFPRYIYLQDGTSVRHYYYYMEYKTPLFCCYPNPLTQTYNSDFSTCTSPGGSGYRYTEVTINELVTNKCKLFLIYFFNDRICKFYKYKMSHFIGYLKY